MRFRLRNLVNNTRWHGAIRSTINLNFLFVSELSSVAFTILVSFSLVESISKCGDKVCTCSCRSAVVAEVATYDLLLLQLFYGEHIVGIHSHTIWHVSTLYSWIIFLVCSCVCVSFSLATQTEYPCTHSTHHRITEQQYECVHRNLLLFVIIRLSISHSLDGMVTVSKPCLIWRTLISEHNETEKKNAHNVPTSNGEPEKNKTKRRMNHNKKMVI